MWLIIRILAVYLLYGHTARTVNSSTVLIQVLYQYTPEHWNASFPNSLQQKSSTMILYRLALTSETTAIPVEIPASRLSITDRGSWEPFRGGDITVEDIVKTDHDN